MNRRIGIMALALAATCAVPGCAEILGLEPPQGGTATGGGTTGGGGTGATGAGGTGGGPVPCVIDSQCPVPKIECQIAKCLDGQCQSEPAADGVIIPCYSGDPATANMGICKTGTQVCEGGVPTTGCAGEVLPGIEDCGVDGDENCDGVIAACSGDLLQVWLFKGNLTNALWGVHVGPAGEIYVAGSYENAGSLGPSCPLPAPGESGAFIAKLSAELECLWVTTLLSTGKSTQLLQLAPWQGGIWAIGSAETAVVIEPAKVDVPLEGSDAVVVGVDPDGALLQAYRIGGLGEEYGVALAAGTYLYALVQGATGYADSKVVPVSIAYVTPFTGADGIVAALTDKQAQWVKTFGSDGEDSPRAIGVLDGRVLIGGGLASVANVASNCALGNTGQARAFLFDYPEIPGGDPLVCTSWLGDGPAYTAGITSAPDGRFALAGYGQGALADGCFAGGTAGMTNAFLRIGDLDNTCLHSKVLASTILSQGAGVKLDGSTVLFAGSYQGMMEGVTSAGTAKDVFIHRYSSDLSNLVWHQELGADGDDDFGSLAVSPLDGTVLVVGSCKGASFEGADVCDEQGDGFLVRLSP